MKKAIKRFLRDEAGAVTVDSVGVIGGSMWMALAVVGDISTATMNLSDKIDERLEYASIIAEILGEYGPGSDRAVGSGGGSEAVDCAGNPGNNKCVGNAGENPTDQVDFGASGSFGVSR